MELAARQEGRADGSRTPLDGDGGDAGSWYQDAGPGGDIDGALPPSPLARSSWSTGDREQLFPIAAATVLAQLNLMLTGTGESPRESDELHADAERCLMLGSCTAPTELPLASCAAQELAFLTTELTTCCCCCCCCCSPAFWICRHLARRFLNQTCITYTTPTDWHQ